MLIDYLRYVAFQGRLRRFFAEQVYNYVEPSFTTGQHLRFSSQFVDRYFGPWYPSTHLDQRHRDDILYHLRYEFGMSRSSEDSLILQPILGNEARTIAYEPRRVPELEIVIDVDPDHWSDRYSERRSYEEIPIVYRPAGTAKGMFRSGDRIVDEKRPPNEHGTLCGIFRSTEGHFGLTCGHVIAQGSAAMLESRYQIWRLPLWSSRTTIGRTMYHADLALAVGLGPVRTHLDAALIALERPSASGQWNGLRPAPISTVLQEDPVRFQGASRTINTRARVAAITIRKSIDLFKNGTLHDMGDVLMLGHRDKMYVLEPVSRPGDSGAAVSLDLRRSADGNGDAHQWYGMVVGADDTGAFATHAEFLWGWAADVLRTRYIDFALED